MTMWDVVCIIDDKVHENRLNFKIFVIEGLLIAQGGRLAWA
jgi:hypothetical protein